MSYSVYSLFTVAYILEYSLHTMMCSVKRHSLKDEIVFHAGV